MSELPAHDGTPSLNQRDVFEHATGSLYKHECVTVDEHANHLFSMKKSIHISQWHLFEFDSLEQLILSYHPLYIP